MIDKAHAFGLFGEQKVFKKLWYDGHWWLAGFVPCLRYNVDKHGFHPLKSIEASIPWDHVAIDLVTPLPVTSDGYDTMLVIVDLMTKYAIIKCLKCKAWSK